MKLITFLGKGAADRKGRYHDSLYAFGGREISTPFFALALAEVLRVDQVVVLGTPASMWDVLLSHRPGSLPPEQGRLLDQLRENVAAESVTADQLEAFAPTVRLATKCAFVLRLIPFADTTATQIELLKLIDGMLAPNEEIAIDVTHAFRHLPMVALTSAILLRKTKGVKVEGVYYGARDMTPPGPRQFTPVIRLDGLLHIFDWIEALGAYDYTGDYGALAAVIKGNLEGRPYLGDRLAEAAFAERIGQIDRAARKLAEVRKELATRPGGALGLFGSALRDRLAWSDAGSHEEQQRQLACHYLDAGDYLRAAILALETHVTRLVEDPNSADRHSIREKALERWTKEQKELRDAQSSPWAAVAREPDPCFDAFWLLNDLRNSLAHHVAPHQKDIRQALKSEQGLRKMLDELFLKLGLRS